MFNWFKKKVPTLLFAGELGARTPSKRDEDAGMDIYALISSDVVIQPGQTVMIPTGLYSAIPQGYYCGLYERGSTGTIGIGQRCGIIDSGYRGQWFVPITNHNAEKIIVLASTPDLFNYDTEKYIVYPAKSKAICQAILHKNRKVNVVEVSIPTILACTSKRGSGALGSSGK